MRSFAKFSRHISFAVASLIAAQFLVLLIAVTAHATDIGEACPTPFTVYPIPTADSNPYAVANGSDGAVWFSELGGGGLPFKIGRVTPAGQITEYPAASAFGQITSLVAGPDDAIWYTTSDGNTGVIGRMTTDGASTAFSLGSSTRVFGLTSGPDGAMWFGLNDQGLPKIGRITTDGIVTRYTILVDASETSANPHVAAITSGPDGALWFLFEAINGGDAIPVVGKVGRMSLDGQFTFYPLSNERKGLGSITSGPDGALWFTEHTSGKIGRITTSGSITEVQAPGSPVSITSAPDGTLWFTAGDNSVNRITVAPYSVSSFYTPSVNSALRQIVAGPADSLWLADQQSSAAGGNTISRILLDTPVIPVPQGLTAPQEWVRAASFSWQPMSGTDHFNVCRDSVMIDTTAQTSYTDPNAVTEGPHVYTVTAVDSAGQESWQAMQIQIGVDNTPPAISNPSWSLNPISAGDSTTLTVTAADGVGLITPLQYRVDNGPLKPMSSFRGMWRATFSSGLGTPTDLPNGTHTIEVLATDHIGNIGSTTTVLVVGLPSPTGLSAVTPTSLPVLTWATIAGADHYDVYRNATLIGSTTNLTFSDTAAPDGSHDFYVKAIDAGGSASGPSNTVTVVVDKTAPVISPLGWTLNPLLQGQTTQLSVSTSDNLTYVAKVEYSIDSGARQLLAYDAASSTWKAALGNNLAANTYSIEVFATDTVGNESVSTDVLAVYNSANGYVTGHARLLPSATDTLPIARDTSNNPAKLIIGFTNVRAATSTTPTSGSFDISYVVKNNLDEFSLSSSFVDWLVVPDSTRASMLGHATLTTYVNGVSTTTANLTVRIDLTLGTAGSADHIKIRIYDPGADPNFGTPHWLIDKDALTSGSHVMIRQ